MYLFFVIGLLYAIRTFNIVIGYAYLAFDQKLYNIIVYFCIFIFGTTRNVLYLPLRMHLAYSEHSRLNNLNIRLTNSLDERSKMISTLNKLNKNASINSLASSVAHEINQPLGAMKLDTELALKITNEYPESTTDLKETLASLNINIDRASKYISNLAKLSQNSSEQNQTTSINQVLNSVINISEARCKKSGIQIKNNNHHNIFINAIQSQVEQVFLNLLNNSIEELEISKSLNPMILVTTSVINNAIQISIEDNGRGVNLGGSESLFAIKHSTKVTGSGIGLWLSKNILSQFDAQIWYESVNTGGSKFIVQFPYCK
jgi:C4-dicarboxylate-specific signal transduction histidine kinase